MTQTFVVKEEKLEDLISIYQNGGTLEYTFIIVYFIFIQYILLDKSMNALKFDVLSIMSNFQMQVYVQLLNGNQNSILFEKYTEQANK